MWRNFFFKTEYKQQRSKKQFKSDKKRAIFFGILSYESQKERERQIFYFLSKLLSDAITQLPMDKTNYQRKEIDKKKETQNEKKLTLTGANGQTHFFKIRPRNWWRRPRRKIIIIGAVKVFVICCCWQRKLNYTVTLKNCQLLQKEIIIWLDVTV